MACDAHYNFELVFNSVRTIEFGTNYQYVGVENIENQITAAYGGGVPCSTLLSVLPLFFPPLETPPGAQVVFARGTVLITPTTTASFAIDFQGNPPVGGSCQVNINIFSGVSLGTYNFDYDAAGVIFNFVPNVFNASHDFSDGALMIVDSGALSGSGVPVMKYTFDRVSGSSNYQDLLGCLVPDCAISGGALPSLGPLVKCANFSKIFNPLGLPLRSK